jgi:hypothetical protein
MYEIEAKRNPKPPVFIAGAFLKFLQGACFLLTNRTGV